MSLDSGCLRAFDVTLLDHAAVIADGQREASDLRSKMPGAGRSCAEGRRLSAALRAVDLVESALHGR